jgi:hypothetical protein
MENGWQFNASSVEETIKPLCQRVEDQFRLPARRLLRYFADSDDEYLRTIHGPHYRGFHAPISSRNLLPRYLQDCFFRPFNDIPEGTSFDEMVAFDNLIYIRRSTCADTTGIVEAYAHELQHFVQHAKMPRLWAVNNVLRQNLKRLVPDAIATDIPSERQANIISKRVAESVCGGEAVKLFADEQVKLMEEAGEDEEKARWIFFRDVPSSTKYDLREATIPLVEKYKMVLDFGIDVNHREWWVGPFEPRRQNR